MLLKRKLWCPVHQVTDDVKRKWPKEMAKFNNWSGEPTLKCKLEYVQLDVDWWTGEELVLTPSQDLSLWRLLIVAVTLASSYSPHASEVSWLHGCLCVRSVMNGRSSPRRLTDATLHGMCEDTGGWRKKTVQKEINTGKSLTNWDSITVKCLRAPVELSYHITSVIPPFPSPLLSSPPGRTDLTRLWGNLGSRPTLACQFPVQHWAVVESCPT